MSKKTVTELSKDVSTLSTQLADFLAVAPTKADLAGLATKADLANVVKKEDLLKFKAELKEELHKELDERFSTFRQSQTAVTNSIDGRVTVLEQTLERKIIEVEANTLKNDMNSRRTNFLLLGVPENEVNWKETEKDCLKHINKYLDIMLPDASTIEIIDCHRLGKKNDDNVTPNGAKKCRPIIFKVRDMFMVRSIRDNLSNLKDHFKNNPSESRVSFRRHLPHKMYLQRKALQPTFTRLYEAHHNPKWELDFSTAKFFIKDKYGNKFSE